ncbi:MAG TPA: hypothetical protein VD962_04170 [Rubricoccaceae bacterium]|nr:hypothetical protein [Rubricoccaceae bacterium]
MLLLAACELESGGDADGADSTMAAGDQPHVMAANDTVAGRYLVVIGGCNDCHTPGFMQDPNSVPEAQWLTGLPIGFRGPWGTSYPRNLRLTAQQWDEETWVQTLRTRHTLPPMPWHSVNNMSEHDTRAIYRYIRSLGPAGQAAPLPAPPGQEPTTPYFDFVPQHMERMPGGPPPGSPAAPGPATPAPTTPSPTPPADTARTL